MDKGRVHNVRLATLTIAMMALGGMAMAQPAPLAKPADEAMWRRVEEASRQATAPNPPAVTPPSPGTAPPPVTPAARPSSPPPSSEESWRRIDEALRPPGAAPSSPVVPPSVAPAAPPSLPSGALSDADRNKPWAGIEMAEKPLAPGETVTWSRSVRAQIMMSVSDSFGPALLRFIKRTINADGEVMTMEQASAKYGGASVRILQAANEYTLRQLAFHRADQVIRQRIVDSYR